MIKDNKIIKYLLLFFAIFFINTMSVFAQEIDVEEFKVLDKSTTTEVDNISFDSNTVTSNIKFNNVNDYVDFGLNLKNKSNNKYKIVSITDNNKNKNLDITYEYEDEDFSNNDITNVKIKMLYKKKLINEDKKLIDDLKVTIVLEDNNGNQEQIIINPNTRDNIIFYVVIFIIAATALILLKHNYKKTSILIILLTIASIPVFIFAKEEYKVNIYFDSIEVKGFYEDYTITVDEDNDNTYSFEIKAGQPIGDLPSPTKRGYTFKEWQDGNGNVITDETIAKKNMTIKAIYNINTYNITYNLNEGSATNVTSYTVEDEVVLNNPTKLGYIFVGWTGSNGDNPEVDLVINRGTIGNKEYTANFIIDNNVPYTVIHKKQNVTGSGYTTADTDHKTGTASQEITPAVKDYYGFTAPSAQTTTIEPDGSTVVTYEYTRNKFTLTLQDTEMIDTEFTSGDYYYETSITVKAKAKQGYNFVRWSTGSTNNDYTFNLNENTTLKPIYEARTDTAYTVIHKKQNVTGSGYTVAETENLQGKTDSPITPGVKDYYGFTAPSTQTTTIEPDGSTVVTYEYTRNKFTLTLQDTEMIDTEFTSGDYYYETSITVKAKAKQGYNFVRWSTGSTNNDYTFNLNENTTLKPIYEARTDTAYTVIHKKQNVTGSGYTVAETENLQGKTDSPITPGVKEYTGFNSPSTQTTTIKPDGSTVVTYEYTRIEYTLTINNSEYVETETPSGTYRYEQSITLTAKTKTGYRFIKWSNDETTPSITFTMESNVTIEPIYEVNSYIIRFDKNDDDATGSMDEIELDYGESVTLPANGFTKQNYIIDKWNTKRDGTGTSYDDLAEVSNLTTGHNVTITLYVIWKEDLPSYSHPDPITFDGQTMIDTGIQLFTEDYYQKNFEISLDIDNIDQSRFEQTSNKDTIIGSINESGSPWPGTAFRISNKKYEFVGTSGIGTSSKPQIANTAIEKNVKIIRIDEKLYYKVDNTDPVLIKDFEGFNLFFDDTVTLGGALENGVPKPDRYFYGTISNVSIKFISDDAEISDYNRVSNLQTLYELAGPYEFDGTTDKVLIPTYTVDNEETPIRLFTSDNYKKDFEISFNIDSYNREGQVNQATLINAKYENQSAGYPGVAVRIVNNDTKFTATSTKNGTRKQQNFPDNVTSVKLIRESGIIKYSYNNNIPITLENYNDFTEFFNTPVSIGGIIDSNNQIDRCIVMTISDLVIKMDP